MLIELDAVDRITADAVGPAGARVFYLQGRQGDRLITLLVEKQQVQLLAASIVEILARIGRETGEGPPEKQMALDEPIPWAAPDSARAGTVHVGGTFEEIAQSEAAVGRGEIPERPKGMHWGTYLRIGMRRGDLDAPARAFTDAVARQAPGVEVAVLTPGETLVLEAR